MEMIETLRELMRIPSVTGAAPLPGMPYGKDVHDALEKALAVCERLGFRTQKCGDYLGYAEIGEGKELMGILVHLDIVPLGNGWNHDPFGGEILDGKIYGLFIWTNTALS